MESSSSMMLTMMIFLWVLISLFCQFSECGTVVVDGVSEWKNPLVQVGDSVIFQHKYLYKLYIFKNEKAYDICNFSQATLLRQANSTSYTWHTSRPGFFYFSFNNGSNKPCLQGQKLAVKVSLPSSQSHDSSPEPSPQRAAPPPSSGGTVSSSPAFPWPFQPRESTSPSPTPALSMTTTISPVEPSEGIPFINSNPVVPLPSGEVDSATIRPWPISGDEHPNQATRLIEVRRACSYVVLLLLIA